MKKYILFAALVISSMLPQNSSAQVNVNVNLTSQPLWGPVGYNKAEYYYLPDIESYYHVPSRQFVYLSNNNWVFSSDVPSSHSNYDLYKGYKVVLNTPKPYLNFTEDKIRYARYKGAKGQAAIKYTADPRYTQVNRPKKNTIPPGQAKKISARTYRDAEVASGKGKKN